MHNVFKKRSDELKVQKPKLWTKNFVILVFGSFVSMAGTDVIDTVLGLLMLDITGGSGLYYSLILSVGSIAGVIVPIAIGTYAEKWPKVKAIYMMDFCSAIVFLLFAFLCQLKLVSEAIILIATFIFESINMVYGTVYDCLLPMVVSKDLYNKGYSVDSIISDSAEIASLIGLFSYEHFGAVPVLIFASICFFIAACFETRIKADHPVVSENHVKDHSLKGIFAGYKEVWHYIWNTVGFTEVTALFLVDCFRTGAVMAMLLPYFEFVYSSSHLFSIPINREDVYIVLMAFYSIGQFWGGVVNYFLDAKPKRQFALIILISLGETLTTGLSPLFAMGGTSVFLLIAGICATISGCTYDTIMYERVPAGMRARFSGFLGSVSCVVFIVGNFIGGLIIDYALHPEIGFISTAVFQIAATVALAILFFPRFRTFFYMEIFPEK